MKIYNTILTREFEECDYKILRLWYKKNKALFEKNFYENDILMSGTIKVQTNNVLEILYLKYFSEKEIDVKEALRIYLTGEIIFPTYEDYILTNQGDLELDVVNKIIRRIIPVHTTQIANKEQYYDECSKIKAVLNKSFSHFLDSRKKLQVNTPYSILDIVKEKELSFVGIAAKMLPEDFGEMICCKILEKLFGSNDIYGIYYKLRKRGWIYTGLSGYVIEESLFYSGAIMQYNEEHEKEILMLLERLTCSFKEFENAKKMVLDDYKYSIFQYGEEFAMLPYKLQDGSAEDFETQLARIKIENVEDELKYVYSHRRIVRMKVI